MSLELQYIETNWASIVGKEVGDELESTKWYLWHGNVGKALDCLETCLMICDDDALHYGSCKKFYRYLDEVDTYVTNNQAFQIKCTS